MTERVRETGTVSDDAETRAWMALPRRIYLDTSTLQSIHDFGEVIFEGEPFASVGGGPPSNDQNLWMVLGGVNAMERTFPRKIS